MKILLLLILGTGIISSVSAEPPKKLNKRYKKIVVKDTEWEQEHHEYNYDKTGDKLEVTQFKKTGDVHFGIYHKKILGGCGERYYESRIKTIRELGKKYGFTKKECDNPYGAGWYPVGKIGELCYVTSYCLKEKS